MDSQRLEKLRQQVLAEAAQQQQVAPQSQGVSGRGGFLTSLISEGGAAGGAALGTALLPGLGTIAGAGIGALVGRLGENKIRDDEFKLGSALGEAAFSAGTASIAPLFRGAKAVKAAKAAGSADDLASVFAKGFSTAPTTGKAAAKLAQASDDASIRSFKFNRSQLQGIRKLTGKDASQISRKLKLAGKSVDDLQEQLVKLNAKFGDDVANIGDITVGDMRKSIIKEAQKYLDNPVPELRKVGQQIIDEGDALLANIGDDAASLSASRWNAIKGDFDGLTNFKTIVNNPVLAGKQPVNKALGSALRETIRTKSGSDSLKNLGLDIRDLTEFTEAAFKQADLGRGTLPIGLTDTIALVGGTGAGGPVGGAAAFAGKRAINSPRAQAGLSSALASASELAARAPQTGFGTQLAGQLAARAPGQLMAQSGQTSSMMPTTIPNDMASNSSITNMLAGGMTPDNMMTNAMVGAGQLPQSQAEMFMQGAPSLDPQQWKANLLLKALQQGASVGDLSEIEAILDLKLQAEGLAGGAAGLAFGDLNADSQKRVVGLQNVESDLANLERDMMASGLFTDESQLQATLGGFFDRTIGQAVDPQKRAFIDQLRSRGISIIRALGEVGNLSATEQAAAIANLPNVGDNLETANIKLNSLKERFSTAKQNIIGLNTGQIPLGGF